MLAALGWVEERQGTFSVWKEHRSRGADGSWRGQSLLGSQNLPSLTGKQSLHGEEWMWLENVLSVLIPRAREALVNWADCRESVNVDSFWVSNLAT